MNAYRYVVFGHAYGNVLRANRDEKFAEVYWRGKPCSGLRKSLTGSLSKAAQFDTADEARAAVNEMVNREHAPQTLLDMRVGRRMIVEEDKP